MFDATFDKYILVVALFVAFLVLANWWAWKSGAWRPRRYVSPRRRRRRTGIPGGGLDDDALPKPGFFGRWHLWLSLVALAMCGVALGVMWWAATLAR